MTKPVVNEKLMSILLSVVNECENCSMMGERQMCQASTKEEMREKCAKQAHDQIIELFREWAKECLPKKKDGVVALLDKQGKRYYKTEQLPDAYWNECITEAEKKIGGDR